MGMEVPPLQTGASLADTLFPKVRLRMLAVFGEWRGLVPKTSGMVDVSVASARLVAQVLSR